VDGALAVFVVVTATIEGESAKADAGEIAAEPDEQAARSTARNEYVGKIPSRFEGAARFMRRPPPAECNVIAGSVEPCDRTPQSIRVPTRSESAAVPSSKARRPSSMG
jgi:hypothetical protein